MPKTEVWTHLPRHRRLAAAALAALFLITCTGPHRTGREPLRRSAPTAPEKVVVDDGLVRLEALDEEQQLASRGGAATLCACWGGDLVSILHLSDLHERGLRAERRWRWERSEC